MVTIDTRQDLLRILSEDSEFKSEVRRIILSEEMLNLPAMASRIDGRLRLDDMETRKDRMNDTYDELKGYMMKLKLQNKVATIISDMMVLRNGALVRGGHPTSASDEFSDAIYEAYRSGVITTNERNRMSDTDYIVRATSRETLNAVYVAVEASYVIDRTDVNRAHQTAEIVAKIFPEAEVFAMVCGRSINSNGTDTAQNLGVVVYDSA